MPENSFVPVALFLLPLCACGDLLFARADESSVVIRQAIGKTIPGAPRSASPQPLASFALHIPDLPAVARQRSSREMGVDVTMTMKVNDVRLVMPDDAAADFDGFESLTLSIADSNGQHVLAQYRRRDGLAPGKAIVLGKGEDLELLDYLDENGSGDLSLTIAGDGTPPSSDWTADVDFDVRIAVEAKLP